MAVGHLSVSVPDGWKEESASGKWDKKFVGDGIELQVSGSFSTDPRASAAFSRLDLSATTQLSDYKQTKALENADLKGADSSVRADFSYPDDGTSMEGSGLSPGHGRIPQLQPLRSVVSPSTTRSSGHHRQLGVREDGGASRLASRPIQRVTLTVIGSKSPNVTSTEVTSLGRVS